MDRLDRDVLDVLADESAVLLDHHFVYVSGKHGPNYINMDPVFPYTDQLDQICFELATPFGAGTFSLKQVDVVAGAATGGIPLAVLTARHFGGVDAVWADKVSGGGFAFERAGFAEALKGKRVLVVEDLLNQGETTRKVIAEVRKHGGEVIGVSVVCNRGGQTAESLGVPRLVQLSSVDFQAFDADSCPLCAEGRPIVEDIGHGGAYKAVHPDYAGGYVTLLSR